MKSMPHLIEHDPPEPELVQHRAARPARSQLLPQQLVRHEDDVEVGQRDPSGGVGGVVPRRTPRMVLLILGPHGEAGRDGQGRRP